MSTFAYYDDNDDDERRIIITVKCAVFPK